MNILVFQCYNCDKIHEVELKNYPGLDGPIMAEVEWDDRFREVTLGCCTMLHCPKCKGKAWRLVKVRHT